jgi:hypothetical protein
MTVRTDREERVSRLVVMGEKLVSGDDPSPL